MLLPSIEQVSFISQQWWDYLRSVLECAGFGLRLNFSRKLIVIWSVINQEILPDSPIVISWTEGEQRSDWGWSPDKDPGLAIGKFPNVNFLEERRRRSRCSFHLHCVVSNFEQASIQKILPSTWGWPTNTTIRTRTGPSSPGTEFSVTYRPASYQRGGSGW